MLLECMSNLAANEVFSPEGAKEHAYEAICDGILHLKEQAADVCVVTNEIFSDGMVYDKETENYQRLLEDQSTISWRKFPMSAMR